ncbi:MAG: Hsp20/alpha crystallin family protein, partial [Casimicrobiaceae bacterium]
MHPLLARTNVPSLFDEFFRDMSPGFFVKPLHGDPLPTRIAVDVSENDSAYIVNAEIPGVKKEDIHIDIDGNMVTLRAEVKQEDRKTEGEKVLRSERYYGAVSRSFQLPMEIDANAAKAKYEN